MNKWEVITDPYGAVGEKNVRCCIECEDMGKVSISGEPKAVNELLASLVESYDASLPKPQMVRFVFVDAAGEHAAMAFEMISDIGEIGLDQIEEVENFASRKLQKSVLALTWSFVASPVTQRNDAEAGEDVVGGVKCEAPLAPGMVGGELDGDTNKREGEVIGGPWAAPV